MESQIKLSANVTQGEGEGRLRGGCPDSPALIQPCPCPVLGWCLLPLAGEETAAGGKRGTPASLRSVFAVGRGVTLLPCWVVLVLLFILKSLS